MSVPTLQQLIEEYDAKKVVCKVIIGGWELPTWISVTYQFDIGQVPTAQIVIPGLAYLPNNVQEEASVQIWLGYQSGSTVLFRLVFGGAVVDSIGNNGAQITITCVMDGPRKLSYSYNRRIAFDFDNVTAEEAVTALLELAGVANYSVNLDPWLIGTAVPYTAALDNQLQFSTYGDAINKVAEVDGTPWYALPTGQVRVEDRDPIPSPSARRQYFTSILTGPIETQPVGISNPDARPRITDISKNKQRREVANFIEVDGAVVVTIGPNGERNSDQIKETVDGLSGQFPNGAYWIPTPPLFQDFNFSNELIDTNAKAFEVAERYFDLKNRLFEELPITVPGDPDVFLCETVEVKDIVYSGTSSLYFVKGYSTTIDQNSCTTTLNLTGGPESGTTGFASPFAEFYWKYTALEIKGGSENPVNLGPNKDIASKLCEDLPEDTADPEQTEDPTNPITRVVYIGLDGSSSQDFDGYIVQWIWTWRDSTNALHTLSGPYQTLAIDPSLQGSIQVTLEVTDNSGRTDSITKNINTSMNNTDPPTFDPTMDDTEEGGGVASGPCTDEPFPNPYCVGDDCESNPGECEGLELSYYVAASSVAMGSLDNRTWNDLTKVAAGASGNFISVDAGVNNQAQTSSAIFGTDAGEVVKSTDVCATGAVVFTVPGNPRIECIHFDTEEMGSQTGELPTGDIPVYTFDDPGTLTIVQAYQQCRAVGFNHASAIIAVAIMIAESGLYSKAVNTAGNTPPSTDRGIAQFNDFYHPEVSDACAYNTECAIQAMYKTSAQGSDFTAWGVNTISRYREHLSEVHAAVDSLSDSSVSLNTPNVNVSPSGLKVWLGTSDGRIFVSYDSGDNWELWKDFGDGLPIMQIGTPPRYGAQFSSLWAFGGNSGDIDSLVRIDPAKDKNFVSLFIDGDLRAALQAAGAGDYCLSSMNQTASILVFHGGAMTSRIWTNLDPLGDPTGWFETNINSGTFNTVAPGNGGEFVVAGSTVVKTSDNDTFSDLGSGPDTVYHILWRGLPGMYIAAIADGLYTTLDFGDVFGALRPNATLGTTWPVDAIGYQVAVGFGARTCPVITPGSCDGVPYYEAAAGIEVTTTYFDITEQQIGAKITGASVDVPDTALVTSNRNASHNTLGQESGSGSSLDIDISPTITDSFLFLAVVSRPGDVPSSISDTESLTWTQIDTQLRTDSIGNIRLTVYRANANADSILGMTVTVNFGSAQDIILAAVDEYIGLSTAAGDDPVVEEVTADNTNDPPVDYPDDYLLAYVFSAADGDFSDGTPVPPSFGIALQLETCTAVLGIFFVAQDPNFIVSSAIGEVIASVPTILSTYEAFGQNAFCLKSYGGVLYWIDSAAADQPLYRSTDEGVTVDMQTSPGGNTTLLHFDISGDGTIWAVVDDGGTIKIFTSADGGGTWSAAVLSIGSGSERGKISIACHPTDATRIAFIDPGVNHAATGNLRVSTNTGASFGTTSTTNESLFSGGYAPLFDGQLRWKTSGRLVISYTAQDSIGDVDGLHVMYSDDDGGTINGHQHLLDATVGPEFGVAADGYFGMWRFDDYEFVFAKPAFGRTECWRTNDETTWEKLTLPAALDLTSDRIMGVCFINDNMYVLTDWPEVWEVPTPKTSFNWSLLSSGGDYANGTQDEMAALV